MKLVLGILLWLAASVAFGGGTALAHAADVLIPAVCGIDHLHSITPIRRQAC